LVKFSGFGILHLEVSGKLGGDIDSRQGEGWLLSEEKNIAS
jgi:hypothetical protein